MSEVLASELGNEYRDLRDKNAKVLDDRDNFEAWTDLVTAAEQLDGGLNRNSDPQAISAYRKTMDAFLFRYPLFFGYWKRYADNEFNIAGTEAAELVYERGIGSISNSVDLFTNYCAFKMDTTHDYDNIRDMELPAKGSLLPNEPMPTKGELATMKNVKPKRAEVSAWIGSWWSTLFHVPRLNFADHRSRFAQHAFNLAKYTRWPNALFTLFERAASVVGTDPRAETFWDKYLEFEARLEQPDREFQLLYRIIQLPLLRYQDYFEKFMRQAQARQVDRLFLDAAVVDGFRKELQRHYAMQQSAPLNDLQFERELHGRVDQLFAEINNATRAEVVKRWTFETEKIQRGYYLPQELPETEIQAWRDYLSFEEAEGDESRIIHLYERCLIACANYDEFWLRYARWMASKGDTRREDVRNVFKRACYIHVPISRPFIRFLWAKFEETQGNVGLARDIYESVIAFVPTLIEPIIELANMERRHGGLNAAIKVYRTHIDSQKTSVHDKGRLVSEWAQLLWKIKGSPDECRTVYQKNSQYYKEVSKFWLDWFNFELQLPTGPDEEEKRHESIRKVFEAVQKEAQLPPEITQAIAHDYQAYLSHRGPSAAFDAEFMAIDREFNGPLSIRSGTTIKVADGGPVVQENGHNHTPVKGLEIQMGKQAETPFSVNGQAPAVRFGSR